MKKTEQKVDKRSKAYKDGVKKTEPKKHIRVPVSITNNSVEPMPAKLSQQSYNQLHEHFTEVEQAIVDMYTTTNITSAVECLYKTTNNVYTELVKLCSSIYTDDGPFGIGVILDSKLSLIEQIKRIDDGLKVIAFTISSCTEKVSGKK